MLFAPASLPHHKRCFSTPPTTHKAAVHCLRPLSRCTILHQPDACCGPHQPAPSAQLCHAQRCTHWQHHTHLVTQMLSHEKPLLQRPLCAGVATAKTAYLSATWCCPVSTAAAALPASYMYNCGRGAACRTNESFLPCVCHCMRLLGPVKLAPQLRSQQGLRTSRQWQEQAACDGACGARVSTSLVVLLQTAVRDLRLCVVAGAAGLPCPLQVLKH